MPGGAAIKSDRCWEESIGPVVTEMINGLAGETQSWLVAEKELALSLRSLVFWNFFRLITVLSVLVKITSNVPKSS